LAEKATNERDEFERIIDVQMQQEEAERCRQVQWGRRPLGQSISDL